MHLQMFCQVQQKILNRSISIFFKTEKMCLADAVPDPEPKSTNTAVALVSDLSPSLAESVDTAQRKVQEARPNLIPVDGVAAARHALLSAFLVQPAHAGHWLLHLFQYLHYSCLHVLDLRNACRSWLVCTCKLYATQLI